MTRFEYIVREIRSTLDVDKNQVFVVIDDREVQFSIHKIVQGTTRGKTVKGEPLIYNLSNAISQFSLTMKCSKPNKNLLTPSVFIIEVLHHTDPQIRTLEAKKTREFVIENLARRGTWEILLEEDVPKGANMNMESFVVTIKDVETENPIFKTCFVAHGNIESEKDQLVHDYTTACQS